MTLSHRTKHRAGHLIHCLSNKPEALGSRSAHPPTHSQKGKVKKNQTKPETSLNFPDGKERSFSHRQPALTLRNSEITKQPKEKRKKNTHTAAKTFKLGWLAHCNTLGYQRVQAKAAREGSMGGGGRRRFPAGTDFLGYPPLLTAPLAHCTDTQTFHSMWRLRIF